MSHGMKTSEKSTGEASTALTSSVVGSPVSPSPSLAKTVESMTNATCGPRPSVQFASWDPATSSWRTSQGSLLTGTLEPYSETWPKAGTMRSGTLLRLRKSERRTAANASSSWPTPDAGNMNDGEDPEQWAERRTRVRETANNGNGFGRRLPIEARTWPTADANRSSYSNGARGANLREEAALWDTPKASSDKGGSNQRDGQGRLYLDAQARQWPTPRASENEARTTHPTPTQMAGTHGRNLAAESGVWPTPQAADSERASETMMRGNPTLLGASRQAPTTETPGHECSPKCRRLNPLFVEWLQGFPIGHTGSEPSATP